MPGEKQRYYSNMPVEPGDILIEELCARGLRPGQLAERMGWSVHDVNALLLGVRRIDTACATALHQALGGVSSEFWIKLEASYQETVARNRTTKE